MKTYKLSLQTIRERRIPLVVLCITTFIIVGLIGFALMMVEHLSTLQETIYVLALLLGPACSIAVHYSWKRTHVCIAADEIVFSSPFRSVRMKKEAVRSIIVKKAPDKAIQSIILLTQDSRLSLRGFENMEGVVADIVEGLPKQMPIASADTMADRTKMALLTAFGVALISGIGVSVAVMSFDVGLLLGGLLTLVCIIFYAQIIVSLFIQNRIRAFIFTILVFLLVQIVVLLGHLLLRRWGLL